MGTDYNIYVGPFVVATYEPKIVTEKSEKLYCTDNCFEKGSHVNVSPPNKFCPKCGAVCEPEDIQSTECPDWYELIGDDPLSGGADIEDAVLQDFDIEGQFTVLTLNHINVIERDLSFDPKREIGSLDISKINIEYEKSTLLEYCADEIKILKENYKDVRVEWGMIYWMS